MPVNLSFKDIIDLYYEITGQDGQFTITTINNSHYFVFMTPFHQ